jgi:hypothetical protein
MYVNTSIYRGDGKCTKKPGSRARLRWTRRLAVELLCKECCFSGRAKLEFARRSGAQESCSYHFNHNCRANHVNQCV